MSFELGRALLLSEAISREALAEALHAVATEGVPLVRALAALELIDGARLEALLAKSQAPFVKSVQPVTELVDALPEGMCSRLLALPVRKDPLTGTIDVAVADPSDPHPAAEIGFLLRAPIRVVRATVAALEAALDPSREGRVEVPSPVPAVRWESEEEGGPSSETPAWGSVYEERSSSPSALPIPLSTRRLSEPVPLTTRFSPLGGTKAARPPLTASHGAAPPPAPLPRTQAPRPLGTRVVSATASLEDTPFSSASLGVPPPPRIPDFATSRTGTLPPPGLPGGAGLTLPRAFSRAALPTAASDPKPSFDDPATFVAALRSGEDRDAILALLLRGVRVVARKVALFVVRQGEFAGWSCSPEFGHEAKLRAVRIPSELPSALRAASGGSTQLGPLAPLAAHGPIVAVMGRGSSDVAVTPVFVAGRAAVLIVADELGDTLRGTERMERLARAAAEGLEKLVRRR